ncbi:uncharacterized protein OCT59_015460 [Rhizophagus irregularis]|uniref:TPX2 C-terminal domain-containing protein n=2 Tax=Rhizophagus irregularis TaxID=588596 RepID=U9SYE4_RHIID|nr:hypothetical protein GLOIN_2v1845429 [Rhizophagus irregularis DAOM 181602=DAOM 197198]EXX79511.1 hypothetical protein RirG_004860 [Rhizophagus irregularis DAOM 197198w]POG64278.1 hypothetical protein GLOIN_2v1845429 [Rhizophagus irregularis DAOM 181602=DAOM 197198]UZO23116.1 hypothetical protein OCT59_015460 [Rhizophagus irregularis]|eukprot:XP_025171144.1 hypothetical protein GLOIN_2v1845429 [Rhizophagus irregularis DAOM 181602=DAOM 197198]
MFENIEIETPNSQRTFSFLAPHYKDFNNDVTFGEGDSYFGSATSSATGQPLFTPSKNVPFTPVLNGVNGVLYQLNLANSKKVEKLTTKSPLKEPNKIKFLDYNLDVKAVANKENGPPVVKIVKKAVNKANIIPTNTAKQVKNYLGRKSQGIRKRQPIKKPGTVLTIPKPFRFHTRKRPNVINKYSPKSPFISLAERIQQYLEKTPDRFKSKLRSASNYVNLPTKAKSPFLRTKLRAERIKMTNKENEINNDKVQSKPVDSSDVKSGRVKKTKPKITIPVSPHITKPKPPRIIKANPVLQPFKPIVAHRKMDPPKYPLPGEKISQRKAEIREAILKKEAQEQEKARKFKAPPLPSGSPDVLLTVLPLPTTTTTKPFKLRTDIRGEKYQQSFRKKINGLNKREKDDLSFRAKPTPNLLPYRPRKSAKPITEVVGFKLHTDARLEKRKTYDEQRNLRDQEEKILKERKQIEEERNKQQIRQLRTELIHHAQPAKRYAPVKIEFANRKVTKPVSPLIGEKRRKKLQALNESNIRNAMSENASTAKIVPQSKNNNRKL